MSMLFAWLAFVRMDLGELWFMSSCQMNRLRSSYFQKMLDVILWVGRSYKILLLA
uniref:Uncharacterized protein MANES_04G075500 n=1 Tax=Rhizophora mucronata TaxID=61149 RepID=A0A2P2LXT0_RHIMU